MWTPRRELKFQDQSIDDTLGVLLLPRLDEETGPGLVIWTTDRVLAVSGGVVSQLTFDGHAIRSKVRIARRPFRRQAESFTTSLYEAEAVLGRAHGTLIMSVPILENIWGANRSENERGGARQTGPPCLKQMVTL